MIIATLTANIILFGFNALAMNLFRKVEPVTENEYDPSKAIMFVSIGFAILNIIALIFALV